MSLSSIEQLRLDILQRLETDADYRQLFLADPESALAAYDLPGPEVRWFKREIKSLADVERWLAHFGQQTRQSIEEESSPATTAPGESGESSDGDESPERIISTGFAAEAEPETPLPGDMPLQSNSNFYFWLQVGKPVAGSIEATPTALPDDLPPKARLQVVLFSFESEFELTPGEDIGVLEVQENGTVRVVRFAAKPPNLGSDRDLIRKRLFFAVRTPPKPGPHRLRCNIYYKQTLIQSRLVTMHVMATPQPMEKALVSELDYTLSNMLDGRQLEGMGENKLSIMLNDNGNGTHGFRFFGQDNFKNDAALGEGEIQDLINMARGALRKAAWGDEDPYEKGKKYRYEGVGSDQLKQDLVTFALRGYRFYDALINRLAGDADKAWELADLMTRPGQVQIASKESARLVIPAAFFYDYPLDDGLKSSAYQICGGFLQALAGNASLEESACFQGNCPAYDDDKVICPSGFWGFRHSLGLPLSVKSAPDAATEIPGSGTVKLSVSVSTDPNFTERPPHEKRLQEMGFGWEHADSRDESLDMLKAAESQVVYFYCHGGLHNNLPYLSLGPVGSDRFTRSSLRNKRIRWRKIRPLVFINGCHTTQLSPEMALDLVSGFIEVSHAAGVIGTEITIFEPIAVTFAEECFRRFLIEKQTLGEAIRGARLKMLKDGNPLGLVYIPYALPGLKLV